MLKKLSAARIVERAQDIQDHIPYIEYSSVDIKDNHELVLRVFMPGVTRNAQRVSSSIFPFVFLLTLIAAFLYCEGYFGIKIWLNFCNNRIFILNSRLDRHKYSYEVNDEDAHIYG